MLIIVTGDIASGKSYMIKRLAKPEDVIHEDINDATRLIAIDDRVIQLINHTENEKAKQSYRDQIHWCVIDPASKFYKNKQEFNETISNLKSKVILMEIKNNNRYCI